MLAESKKGKQARVWDLSGNAKADIDSLDYSRERGDNAMEIIEKDDEKFVEEQVMNYTDENLSKRERKVKIEHFLVIIFIP